MKNKKFPAGLLILSLVALTGWSCGDKNEDELVGNWNEAPTFAGKGRSAAATFTIDNTAYVTTGFVRNNDPLLKDLWKFNQKANNGYGTWEAMASMPEEAVGRQNAAAFSVGGYGYVGLGLNYDKKELKDFWKYDPAANSWTRVADFGGTARYGAIAFSYGGYGYVGCGNDDNALNDLWRYDPSADTWTQVTDLPGRKREGASVFVIDDLVYVVGGESNGNSLTDFWAYDPDDDTWSSRRDIYDRSPDTYDDDYTSIARSYAVAFVLNGKGYLTLGEINGGNVRTTWEYDSQTDKWEERTGFEQSPRTQPLGFAVDNRGFAGLGNTYDDVYEFHPTAEYDEYD